MNTTIRRLGVITILGSTALVATACSSSDDNSAAATTVAAAPSDDGTVIDYVALSNASAALEAKSDDLPAATQSDYDTLKSDLETAKNATGDGATDAWSKVKADVDKIDGQISNAGGDISTETQNAWTDVKNEFDKITANF